MHTSLSFREQLAEFRFELKEALQQGVYFLYHVFRDSKKVWTASKEGRVSGLTGLFR
jgi:hypothetical protein